MSELDTISTEFTEISTFVDSSVNYILKHAKKAIDENGCFNIVLCGGITPRLIYSKLAKSLENWHFWNFWFSDERCYPAGHIDLNSSMINEVLFNKIPVLKRQIYYIQTHLDNNKAVEKYRKELSQVDYFDLVLLGVGEDGHTASLFEINYKKYGADYSKDVFSVFNSPKSPAQRITLSFKRLSRSKAVLFLVAGEKKKKVVKQLENRESIPAAYVKGKESTEIFYCLKSL